MNYCPRIARMDTNRYNGINGDRSVALIYTNAMSGGYDDNGDNLGQLVVVFCGRNGNASNYYCPRIIGKYFFCPRIARMDTNRCNGINGDRVGRTNCH